MTDTITAIKLVVEVTNYDDEHRVANRGVREISLVERDIPDHLLAFLNERLKSN